MNNLDRIADKFELKRGSKQEIMSRINLVLSEKDKVFRQGQIYNSAYANCEHLATYILFGEPISLQADHVVRFYTKQLWKDLFISFILYRGLYLLVRWNIVQYLWETIVLDKIRKNMNILENIYHVASWPENNPVMFYSSVVLFAVAFSTVFWTIF